MPVRPAVKKSALRKIYDRIATRYDSYHAFVTLRTDERGRRLVVKHGVRKGDSVLDAGGGTGTAALLAAKKVGRHVHVFVFGLSDRMSFQSGDMLKLPYEDASFDAVLSTYSLCPVVDPERTALELYRVVKPGGRLAVAHSGEPDNQLTRWLAHRLEDAIWRFPQLTLGCRPVVALPALKRAGAKVLFHTKIGIPLYPFEVFVVKKPLRRT